jgi:HNH endonuclease
MRHHLPWFETQHHLVPLADDGEDTIENVAFVCPNHHREVHFGKRREELTDLLRSIRGNEAAPVTTIGHDQTWPVGVHHTGHGR